VPGFAGKLEMIRSQRRPGGRPKQGFGAGAKVVLGYVVLLGVGQGNEAGQFIPVLAMNVEGEN